MLAVEIDPSLVREDSGFPDKDDQHVFEHVRFLCEKTNVMPAATIRATDSSGIIVTRGHKYLRAAKELKRTVRAVVEASSDPDAVKHMLAASGVRSLAADEIWDEPVGPAWHVFFFLDPIPPSLKEKFLDAVRGTGGGLKILDVDYDELQRRLAIQVETPADDPMRVGALLDVFRGFSRDAIRIETYQGKRWSTG